MFVWLDVLLLGTREIFGAELVSQSAAGVV